MKEYFLPRIRIISAGLLLVVLILLGQLYLLQVVRGEAYREKGERQYLNPSKSLYDRGAIYFESKDGNLISAATLKTGYTISMNPNLIEDALEVHDKIEKILDIDDESFFFRSGKKDDTYEEIAKKVEEEEALAILALQIKGVSIEKEKWRFYPGNSVGAQLLGFTGFKDNDFGGRYGLEREYENVLEREERGININFFAEIFSNLSQGFEKNKLREKGDIITTIEPVVETFFQNKLNQVQEERDSLLTAGVIIDPKTGEIIGLVVSPSFDPNKFGKEEDISIFRNSLVEDVYEFGSIMKPITMASALDSGAVKTETTYDDKGFLELDGYKISNFDGKGRGMVDMQEVLNQSLNTGAAFVANEMGNDVFFDYLKNFGLMEKTGIDLPNEASPLIKNLSSSRKIEYATASFGQGVAFSPIMMARALSALGNGGILPTPHLVKKIDYEIGPGKTININKNQEKRTIKKETADEITRMLVRVVDEALLGGTVALPNHSIAAKTGTAQIANPNERGYYKDRFLHSFFGYFPAYEPKFLVFLYTVYPKGARYASETLTKPFMDIAKFLINYYEIPPDR
ncbi:hypothetical protein COV42_01530 [Candidatus Campbellbacteria bacterium CG11_big_fil_rev_8_21_14_0_20_44_21]|uniref:Penicillin-binding protein transpeptidase domain-containing protein n=1 Tax=Candidatus Campbellbacteria bacterium CG22_combo_CG10-13_8_21_14_all_43_18 TaxID=1974530 RepID=A0A2H0DXF0_9BACT|nr:MAG: hypothetical protein COW82_02415 [Candidatus Campbellbacteria bacterium CG22_combo_CG10-13_8_21_14_all_43_18]PIR24286.1 MAG: hypothetical protein COV42_01530 [Candidatus Campbellbacteria bacterium CG11_big_fil_rev_8_21_14_0_20_44_21]